MWFRVELHKDGAVKSCDLVESQGADGRSVYYVDAKDNASAIRAACQAWAQRVTRLKAANNRRRYHDRAATGACVRCGADTGNKSVTQCAECTQKQLAKKKRRRVRGEPLRRDPTDPAEQRAEATAGSVARGKFAQLGGYALEEALRAFDSMSPPRFREWLVQRIESAKKQRDARYQAALTKARESLQVGATQLTGARQ